MAICGESGDVREETVVSWKERLPELLRGYKKEDINSLDETGCFWRALPDHGFVKRVRNARGGREARRGSR